MREQQVSILLKDEHDRELGTLSIIAIDYFHDEENSDFTSINNDIKLKNVDLVEVADNLTPIQYCKEYSNYFANLMFLEETDYQILFESKEDISSNYHILYSLTKINSSFFKLFHFPLGDEKVFKVAGTLNFRSYVGKSFFDVKKDNIKSKSIPIEVRSKKLDYFNQYPQMIADLASYSSSLLFEMNSPLYQEF